MHPKLLDSLDRVQQEFRDDERCLGMFLWGSPGKKAAGEFSDLDVAAVVRDNDHEMLKKELPSVCERMFGQIVAWIPEGKQAKFVNYAFLFRDNDDLLLCDFAVVSENWIINETTDEPELRNQAIRLLEALQWHRPAQVVFKVDPHYGSATLMEVNGRFWGTMDISIQAGVNFPLLACRMATTATSPHALNTGPACGIVGLFHRDCCMQWKRMEGALPSGISFASKQIRSRICGSRIRCLFLARPSRSPPACRKTAVFGQP